ncbi:hypothetical protein, partial [Escherichia coli]|uniref:hypothetical protein n=1 Tax=Escherichia coli TaxID=562 RepID=UPI002A35F86D
SARKLSQLDSSKVLPKLEEIDEPTRELTASDLTAVLDAAATDDRAVEERVVEELDALDETGIARPELDLGLGLDGVTPIKKPKSA